MDLIEAIMRCLTSFRDVDGWPILRARGMREDHSWESSAREYAALYSWGLRAIGREG
jgi:starch synthase